MRNVDFKGVIAMFEPIVLRVIELCDTGQYRYCKKGIRDYLYQTDCDNMYDAITDHDTKWNPDNILCCNDSFSGECLSSETVLIANNAIMTDEVVEILLKNLEKHIDK